MRGLCKTVLSLMLAGAFLSAVSAAQAQTHDGEITIRLPVQLKKMTAGSVRVNCAVGMQTSSGYKNVGVLGIIKQFKIEGGEFDQVVEFVFKPPFTNNPTLGSCTFRLYETSPKSTADVGVEPIQAPPGPELWKRAKPDEFFRWSTLFPLSN